ncbi:hypothetical protein DSCO28_73460 (plasmid) [Desulfosarcina ovata subsp. sediminis]|uniref:Uncharacterized protein n=1 Tax=Desulfosarcina ovata subsp. sediminis TaxID=885957 RepID=A0A5K8A396_9BACT|nr:hypothetical protein [Desulfosarcina ovata]BBO86780.1 hypothetical protein DSCO28_73460 [Desulfosarcina ovata subsp. sediminis]
MIRVEEATPYQQCTRPWVFDHIEVRGSIFTGPATGTHLLADFERPTEEVRFSLLGAYHCDYPSGPRLDALANYAANVTGRGGFYGMGSARRLN